MSQGGVCGDSGSSSSDPHTRFIGMHLPRVIMHTPLLPITNDDDDDDEESCNDNEMMMIMIMTRSVTKLNRKFKL